MQLNVNSKTVKLLEESREKNLNHLGFGRFLKDDT